MYGTATCTFTIVSEITEPPPLITSISATPVSCNGGSDGSAALTVLGGEPGYSYLWSNSAITSSLTGVAAGYYQVTVTDALNCTISDITHVNQSATPLSVVPSGSPVVCNGAANGSVSAGASGGVQPYHYLWSNTQTTATITGLGAGTYIVTVTDAFGCTASPQIHTISSSSSTLNIQTPAHTDITCIGSTGSITVNPTGGVSPYQYSINGGSYQSSNIFSGLAAGSYTVVVQDQTLCSVQTSVTITATGTGCCLPGYTTIDQSAFVNGAIITGNYNLNVSVTIPASSTVTLNACSLALAANVTITVDPSSTFNVIGGSIIFACGGMWNKIYNDGGIVEISNSTILDAIQGLHSFGGQVIISGSTFDHNRTSVYLDNGDFSSSSITGSTFKCTDGAINKAPHAAQLSLYHIFCTSVSNFKLGDHAAAANTFNNAVNGVYARATSIDMENNVFNYDITVPYNVSGTRYAAYIFNNKTETVNFGSLTYPSNTVTNWSNGIFVTEGVNINVQNNLFTDATFASSFSGNGYTSIYIADNAYERCNTATNVSGSNLASYVVVRNNRYNQGLAYDFDNYGYVAINCFSKIPTQRASVSIEGNSIYNTAIGIHIRNIETPAIHLLNGWESDMPNADIPLYALAHNKVPQRGIWIENCPLAYIDRNNITRNNILNLPQYTSGVMESELMLGISTDYSIVTNVKNNHIFNMGTDINVYSKCTSSEIRCNHMTSSFRGINFANATFVTGPDYGSPTDASDNTWNGEYLNINNMNYRIEGAFANTIVPINWYHQGIPDPSNIYCPFYHSFAINPIENAGTQYCPIFPGGDHERLKQNIKGAALNSAQYAEYVPENIFADDQTSFEKAKDDTTLLQMFGGLQSVINQWYNAQRYGNIGRYKDVKDFIAARNFQAAQIAAMSIVDTTIILQNQKIVLQIYLNHYYDENSTLPDSSVIAQLEAIAYQTVAQGGEAVYIARAMLGIDVQDILPIGLRNAAPVNKEIGTEIQFVLKPNPARSKCIAAFNCKANYLLVEDMLGKQIKAYSLESGITNYSINLDDYNQGVYSVKLIVENKTIASQKLVVIK